MPAYQALNPVELKMHQGRENSIHLFLRARTRVALLMLCWIPIFQSPLSAKVSATAVDPGYLPALAVADRFLHAWQTGDLEGGMVLLTTHAKKAVNTEAVAGFFSKPESRAYEIGRGKALKHGRYEFPIVMVTGNSKSSVRRRFSSIVIVDTGHNDWAVDKLP